MLTWNIPSGKLADVTEGEFVQIFLNYQMVPYGTIKIISGELPPGLSFNSSLNAILGTPSFIDETTQYHFTIRLENSDGIADQSFYINHINSPISFTGIEHITDEDNRDFQIGQLIDHKIETDTDNELIVIAGKLPEGVTLTRNGKLVGPIKDNAGRYDFTLAFKNNRKVQKSFYIMVQDIYNRPPYWATLDGNLGKAFDGFYYEFDLTGGDADNNAYNFALSEGSSLPEGLGLSGTKITGIPEDNPIHTAFFNLTISDGGIDTWEREFHLNVNIHDNTTFIDETQLEGGKYVISAIQGEIMANKIPLTSNSKWIRFEVSSGILPNGISLNINNGDFYGTVATDAEIKQYQSIIAVYDAGGDTIDIEVIFDIKMNPRIKQSKLSTYITGESRQKLHEMSISGNIPYERIFRPGDPNFGISKSSEIPIVKYTNTTISEIIDIFKNGHNETFKVSSVISCPYQNSNGNVICEVVVAHITESLDDSQDVDDILHLNIDNIRDIILNNTDSTELGFLGWQSSYMFMNVARNIIVSENHLLQDGDVVYFVNQDMPAPFINTTRYYAIKINSDEFQLAISKENAILRMPVMFNVNEVSRSIVGHRYINGIPLVYCNIGDGQPVANNMTFSDDIIGYTSYLGLGNNIDPSKDVEGFWIDSEFFLKDN